MTQQQVLAQTVSAAALGGPAGAAIGMAVGLAQAVATVDSVLEVLTKAAERLEAAGMFEVDVDDFGGSWAGTNLGTHARKAQTNVKQQLDQLAAGLVQYREDLILSGKDWSDTDDTVAQPLNTLTSLTACVAEDFTTDSGRQLDAQCTPGSEG